MPLGAALGLPQCFRLARAWFGDRLTPEWRPRSAEETQRLFDAVGLSGEFWRVAP
jgi:hypothetical protein